MYKAISLFTGAGGLDYGLEIAGFETVVAIEMDKWCCKTLKKNRPNWNIVEDRLENVTSKSIEDISGLKPGDFDILIGGPPCQPFSKSGYWVKGDAKRLKDPRANTLIEYMRVLNDLQPKAFILENVFGLAYKGKDEGLQFLNEEIGRINSRNKTNYSFEWSVINTADFGVPQIRERVFIIGFRDGTPFKFPMPTHFEPPQPGELAMIPPDSQYRTTWDSLGDLSQPKIPESFAIGGKWKDLLPTIPPGKNYLYHTDRGDGVPLFKWRSRYWSFLLKLDPNKPSWTIQAQPGTSIGPFHWNNRRLTMREMARIQTFPDNIVIEGGITQIQKQIGNAVPSAIGELLGKEIRKQFFGEKLPSTSLTLIPSKRKGKCTVVFERTVPQKYLNELEEN